MKKRYNGLPLIFNVYEPKRNAANASILLIQTKLFLP